LQRASMDVLRFTARRLCRRHRRDFAALLMLYFLATQMFLINLLVRPSAGVTRRVTPALAAAAPASAAPAVVTSETVVWTQKPEVDSSLVAEVQVLSGHYAAHSVYYAAQQPVREITFCMEPVSEGRKD